MKYNSVGIVSKPLDIYNLRQVVDKKSTILILRLVYVNSESANTSYLGLCEKLFSEIEFHYMEIIQLNLYSIPFLNLFVLNKEKNLNTENVIYSRDFRRSDSSFNVTTILILQLFYKLIRVINRVFIIFKLTKKHRIKSIIYTDPFPYKISILSLFSFKEIIFYDGGQSIISFDLLKIYSSGFELFLRHLSNSKYNGLISQNDITYLKGVKSKFYTRYNDIPNFNSDHNIFDLVPQSDLTHENSSLNIPTDDILILGSNFHHSVTIEYTKRIKFYFDGLPLVYRPHPREILNSNIIAFFNQMDIKISFPIYGIEVDLLFGLVPTPSAIIHFDSSSYKTLSEFNKLIIYNYYDL